MEAQYDHMTEAGECCMCGRYFIGPAGETGWLQEMLAHIERRYHGSNALTDMRLGEIYPSQVVPIIAQDGPRLMKWGYTGYKNRVINARSETAFEKPMFRHSMRSRRCLIPASGYYEWQRTSSGAKTKQKYAFYRPGQPIYMAGVWREEKAEALPVFVILTREAAPDIAAIHDRMPVILPDSAISDWLSGPNPGTLLTQALRDLTCYPVS